MGQVLLQVHIGVQAARHRHVRRRPRAGRHGLGEDEVVEELGLWLGLGLGVGLRLGFRVRVRVRV